MLALVFVLACGKAEAKIKIRTDYAAHWGLGWVLADVFSHLDPETREGPFVNRALTAAFGLFAIGYAKEYISGTRPDWKDVGYGVVGALAWSINFEFTGRTKRWRERNRDKAEGVLTFDALVDGEGTYTLEELDAEMERAIQEQGDDLLTAQAGKGRG